MVVYLSLYFKMNFETNSSSNYMKPLYLFTSPEYVGRPVDMFAAIMTIISFYVMVVTLFYLVIDELVLIRPLVVERLRDKP